MYLDGSPVLELSDWTIGKFGLRRGDDLDEQAVEQIKTIEAETQAKNIAINYLSYRPRSSKEVVTHLAKKGFSRHCAEEVVRNLKSLKMIDDIEFANAFIRDRLKRKPTGPILLRQQLLIKGIPSAAIDSAISELISPQSQQAAALQAARRKIQLTRNSTMKLEAGKKEKRLLDFLLRRGFSYEIAMKAIHITSEQ